MNSNNTNQDLSNQQNQFYDPNLQQNQQTPPILNQTFGVLPQQYSQTTNLPNTQAYYGQPPSQQQQQQTQMFTQQPQFQNQQIPYGFNGYNSYNSYNQRAAPISLVSLHLYFKS